MTDDLRTLGRAMRDAQRDFAVMRYHPDDEQSEAAYQKLTTALAAYDKALDEPLDPDENPPSDARAALSARPADNAALIAEAREALEPIVNPFESNWASGEDRPSEVMGKAKQRAKRALAAIDKLAAAISAPPSSPPADNAALIAALEDINGRTCANVVLHANAMVLQSICADCHQISGAALSAAPAKPAASDADLVKEAREIAADMYVGAVARDVIETLANRIEALSAKVEKVERERDMRAASECWYAARLHTSNGQLQRESDARNAAEKERDEARAALRKAHTALHGYGCIDTALAAIRAALSAAPSQQEPTRAAKAGEAG